MRVSQILFSSEPGKRDGHPFLIARSRDIDGRLIEQVLPWVPEFGQLVEGRTESLNYFRPAAHRVALCRSVHIQPSQDSPVGSRLATIVLIMDPLQLRGFDYNPLVLAHTVRSMGILYQQALSGAELPALNLPERTILRARDLTGEFDVNQVESISRAIEIHKQVALFARGDLTAFLCGYLAELPVDRRWACSFATGLQVHANRPFQIHMFPASKPWLKKDLIQDQVRTLNMDRKQNDPYVEELIAFFS